MKVHRLGSDAAWELHRRYPPIDLHSDTLMWSRWIGYDMTKRHRLRLPKGAWLAQVDLPRLADAGMGAQFFGLVSLPVGSGRGCTAAVNEQIDIFTALCVQHPDKIRLTRTATEIKVPGNALSGLLGIEGAHALEGDLDNVARFARRGVRYLGLSHFSSNEACFPAKGKGSRHDVGLSAWGGDLLRELERNNVLVDLAHINKPGFMEVCARAERPVIVSHTGVSGAYQHWRNIDDEQIRALADTGGVIGIIFVPNYLGSDGLDAVLRHMEHVINIGGEDAVALGSDYDGMVVATRELRSPAGLPLLTDAMLQRGWSEQRIAKALRLNILRVL